MFADSLLEASAESVDEAVKSNILPIYLAFLTSEKFFEKHGRYPGSLPDDAGDASDLAEFVSLASSVLVNLGGSGQISEDLQNVLGELCVFFHRFLLCGLLTYFYGTSVRAATQELPQIASFTGGIISQEAIKLITRQYVPTVGNCVYDGIKGACGVIVG